MGKETGRPFEQLPKMQGLICEAMQEKKLPESLKTIDIKSCITTCARLIPVFSRFRVLGKQNS